MTGARRNDPCPCGSGRKYKHCHWGAELPGGGVSTAVKPRSAAAKTTMHVTPQTRQTSQWRHGQHSEAALPL